MNDSDQDDMPGDENSAAGKKAWLNKANCIPNFVCPFCDAGFVRHDSYQSHLGQHKSQLDSSSMNPEEMAQPVVSSNLDVDTVLKITFLRKHC